MASVEVKNISKIFKDKPVLKNVSFYVSSGELFCLLGPPGAGKTTLFRIISGLEKADTGGVFFDGKPVTSVPPQQRDVAMIFEDVALYPHLTGFDNIAYPLKLRRLPRAEIKKRVNEIACLLRIEHLLNRRPHTFSGGERRRVAIARALVRNPRVLLLDQPFTDLDAQIRHEMSAELKRLQINVGQTMLLATHDFEEGMIADRMAVINDGEIHQIAPPKEIYNSPLTRVTTSFVGSPAMNLFSCQLVRTATGCELRHPAFVLSLPWHPVTFPQQVWLGIRPEKIVLEKGGKIKARVEVIQILGAEQIFDLVLANGDRFKWVAPLSLSEKFRRGDELEFDFPISAIFLFDYETGHNLVRKEV
jgi:multiple sugar transport system ATP-binding protein